MKVSNTALRTLMIYAVVLPLAMYVGYLLPGGGTLDKLLVSLVMFGLLSPILLKWHHPMLFLVWNMTAIIGFLPGAPQIWLLMAGVSLGISVLHRTLKPDMRFISVPSVTLPVLFLLAVVLLTAKQTGGFGVRALGGQAVGGKGYFWVLGAVAGFFAMIAHRIPREKARLYVGLFFLGALTNAIGSTLQFVPAQLYYLFYVFPVDELGTIPSLFQENIDRYFGTTVAALSAFYYMLARYGIAGIFQWKRPGRVALLLALVVAASVGGFRSTLIMMVLTFLVLFYFEGLFRTRYAGMLLGTVTLLGVLLIPLAGKLPLGMQRTLSFLPLDSISPVARYDAEHSTEWRVEMWKTAWPNVKKYLWLGKGLLISGVDLDLTGEMVKSGLMSSQEEAVLSGSYHNGPLTLLIPFGVWGAIGWLWFLFASIRALHYNYRYGDPSLKKVNTFLLSVFLTKAMMFFVIFGDFRTEFAPYLGIVALGVALNHGICKPVVARRALAQPIPLRARPALAQAAS